MENVITNNLSIQDEPMNLSEGQVGIEYKIKKIETADGELKDFLFTLGCYPGEYVTIISNLKGNYVITVKDARYSINKELADVVII